MSSGSDSDEGRAVSLPSLPKMPKKKIPGRCWICGKPTNKPTAKQHSKCRKKLRADEKALKKAKKKAKKKARKARLRTVRQNRGKKILGTTPAAALPSWVWRWDLDV